MTTIEPAVMGDVDAIVDAWVSLAESQRAHGSDLLGEGNRDAIRDAVGTHVLSGTLLVARDAPTGAGEAGTADGESPAEERDSEGANNPDVVGFVMFGPAPGRFERDSSRAVVRNLWVREDHRGAGIGADLLARAERDLAASGFDVVVLEAMAENAAARSFYEREGYEQQRVEYAKELTESDTHTN